ncbi:MAG: shikimate kinase [Alphaproteobacteria bacterium]|nr:shikimate kinase [Alphaproteobacteria bacterium]
MADIKHRDKICATPIVLIGMMGAGKSSLGVRLADVLDMPFRDADSEIEKAAAMRVAEIFEQHGEQAFRDGERRVIKRLLGEGPMVLALGGGAFIDDATRALVQEKALSIWLDVPVDELVARVKKKPDKRPLLKGQNIAAKLQELMQERGPVYQTARLKVDVSGGTHEDALDRLLAALSAHYA